MISLHSPARTAVPTAMCLLVVSVVAASEGILPDAHTQVRLLLQAGAAAAAHGGAAAAAAGPSQPPPPTAAFSCPPGANFTNDQQGNGQVDLTGDQATVRHITDTDQFASALMGVCYPRTCPRNASA